MKINLSGRTFVKVNISFTALGKMVVNLKWPEAANEDDRDVDFIFNGKRWIKLNTGTTIKRSCGYGEVLYQISDKIIKVVPYTELK